MPKFHATHADLATYTACKPMDCYPTDVTLLTKIDGVRVSVMGNPDARGLMIAIEEPRHRIVELALTRPVAIRNAVYAVVGAMGEPLRLEGVDRGEPGIPATYVFVAESHEQ